MPLRLKLGSEILIVYLYLKSLVMTLKKHSIVAIPTVIKLLVNLLSLLDGEINHALIWISEITNPQSFTFNLR